MMEQDTALFSAVILAGGYSLRMGRNKAELMIGEKTFLQHLTDKLKAIGIGEILISGYEAAPEGTRMIRDRIPHKGPLSGIHAALMEASFPACLVLPVDMPLLPEEVLKKLVETHTGSITLLQHNGQTEPLVGVYDCRLAALCGEILKGERTAVKELLKKAGHSVLSLSGDDALFRNFNTPEEYEELTALLAQMSK